MIVLAEIGDKMPSIVSTLLVSVALAAIAASLGRLRWWLALIALPVFGWWNWIHYANFKSRDSGIKS